MHISRITPFNTAICMAWLILPCVGCVQNDSGAPEPGYVNLDDDIEIQRFDVGWTHHDSTIAHDFVVSNESTTPLRIIQAATTCGCTQATWDWETIAPGESAKVHVAFAISGRSGHASQQVVLTTDRTERPKIALIIECSIFPTLSAYPSKVDFPEIVLGATEEKELRVWVDYGAENKEVQVKAVESTMEGITCELARATLEEEAEHRTPGWVVKLKARLTDKFGMHTGVIRIQTTVEDRPWIEVPITANVVPDVIVSPSSLVWGWVAPGDQKQQVIEVISRTGSGARILSVSSDRKDLIAEILESKSRSNPNVIGRIEIRRDVNSPLVPGMSEGRVKILTDYEPVPEIEIPVMWVVKPEN